MVNSKDLTILNRDGVMVMRVNPQGDLILNAQTLELRPKADTVSISVGIEKYDNPNIEIIGDEIVAKLGKVKIGGVK